MHCPQFVVDRSCNDLIFRIRFRVFDIHLHGKKNSLLFILTFATEINYTFMLMWNFLRYPSSPPLFLMDPLKISRNCATQVFVFVYYSSPSDEVIRWMLGMGLINIMFFLLQNNIIYTLMNHFESPAFTTPFSIGILVQDACAMRKPAGISVPAGFQCGDDVFISPEPFFSKFQTR